MSIQSLLVLAVSVGLVLASAHAVGAQLILKQVQAVVKCQDTIDREGRALVRKELEAVEGCALAKLNPTLRIDNLLIDGPKFDADNDKATTTCNRLFKQVELASTRFINAVIRACTPVEAIILAPDPPPVGDPLGFFAFWNPVATVEELAGLLCGDKVLGADFIVAGQAPRGFEIWFFDPDVVAEVDPRCIF